MCMCGYVYVINLETQNIISHTHDARTYTILLHKYRSHYLVYIVIATLTTYGLHAVYKGIDGNTTGNME